MMSGDVGVSAAVVFATGSDLKEEIDKIKSRHDQVETGVKKSASMEMFPWITEFRALCRSSFTRQGPSSLIKLIRFFNRNVSSNVNDCYKKSSRAAKLKELIKDALLLFVYFHRFEQPQDQNRTVYLDQMSDLLAMYIDLELVASKRNADPQHNKISARLVSCLYVYLENSTEHLLDTLIKIQLMNETHLQILDAVISKIFKIIPAHPETEVMYVRYLLVYRLWKKIHSNLAVKKQINANAISSLRSLPTNLPVILLEQVLPSTTVAQGKLSDPQSTKFYLCQHFDLRKACSQFLQYCRSNSDDEATSPVDDIIQRDQRLKSTITSERCNVDSVNIEFSKSSNSFDKHNSIKNIINIPFTDLKIESNNQSRSNISNDSSSLNDKSIIKPEILSRNKKSKHFDDVVLIDLTDEEVTKIVKCKKRRKISWLENAKRNIDAKIKVAAMKRDKDTVDTSLKINEEDFKEIFPTPDNNKSSNVMTTELESKLSHSPQNPIDDLQTEENNLRKEMVKLVESRNKSIDKTNSSSSPPDSSASEVLRYDNDSDSVTQVTSNNDQSNFYDYSTAVIERSNSLVVSSSNVVKFDEEKGKVSALRDINVPSIKKQPADSTVSNVEALKEVADSSDEGKITDLSRESRAATKKSDVNFTAATSVAENIKLQKILESKPVDSAKIIKDKNYYSSEQKVQPLTTEKIGLPKINESDSSIEEKLNEKENDNGNNDASKPKSNPTDTRTSSIQTKENGDVFNNIKRIQTENSVHSATSNGFYSIQDSEIDGLTLLASVSAQQQLSTNKKMELKVKPYSSLQQKQKDDDNNMMINRIIGMYPEDALDKVALQVEVSSTELVTSTVNKQKQSHDASSDLLSYILDESIQNNLESNDNANVILNGETVMLLQKSPNSNLYIINKAAVDNMNGSNGNYNSDDEDGNKLIETEDTKCCQQMMIMKHEPDDVVSRGRIIKPDPDYIDVKSNALAHEESKHPNQSQGYELHYAGYAIPPPGSFCTYPNIHHPSTGCACVSCAYCRQLPYYLPATHAIQSVQTHSAVQEKRISKKIEASAMLAKLYDDELLCSLEKGLIDGKHQKPQQEQIVAEEEKEIVRRFKHVDSKLPLKKRLKAQRMMSMNFTNQSASSPHKNEDVTAAYPGTLMMSIADVEVPNNSPDHDHGNVIEMTSAAAKPNKNNCKERTMNNKTNNQNVPNCFSKKANGKKRLGSTDEEVENSGVSVPKKSKKSNGCGLKQTRSSRRTVPTVNYVYPEIDPEWNPSGKRKRKRNNR
ncbi:PREDICTED: uncharacterized protein LOC105360408 [Ceratosolen solmsi marchali]|uniref:Uncharacterized protein LOC105360408 n=1 Tax=Ceratosolen solmsi marchali TaxID=326594 RepID=A0AAJ6VLU9_9HYME|nr:PREDICTED: uncharacterized protein LOC105360408 [Ceratosolen solmsi marchali]